MITYDIVIIGSGLGGLKTAYILAKEGLNVCVLEQGKQFGGAIQNFKREGVVFDTGAHYVGALDEGQLLHRFFDYFDFNSKIKVKRLDSNGFDKISFGDQTTSYAHAMGFDNFAEHLAEKFPTEKNAILKYTEDIKDMGKAFPLFNLRSELGVGDVGKYTKASLSDYISSLTPNKRLQNVLLGSNLLYTGEEQKTPLYVHGLITNSYIQSAYRFVGGSGQLADFLIDSIRSFGGKVLNNKKVVKLEMKDSVVSYAETDGGERFYAKNFISNVHPKPTFEMLPEHITKKVYFKRVSSIENTISVFSLYIVFKKNSFKYLNHNIYHYRSNDIWTDLKYDVSNWPKSILFLTQVPNDGGDYADGATVMSFMNYSEFAKWEGTQIENRPEEYEALKKQKEEQMLDFVEERFPGIRGQIKSVYSSTPLTYKDYTATEQGAIYGVTRDYNQQSRNMIMTNTKIPNLYLTGQNVNLHGVLGVGVGAVMTASKFLGMDYLLQKIADGK
ncbi:MAG: all-trans-retinol 13,14-reductase [Bacteroidetes bacterium]|nr:MAG: all-trans-retinol 13,14-reductase [Bacteroidota bacterium]